MEIFEVIRTDLDDCCGRFIGKTILKRYLSEDKAIKFKKEWEDKWKNNYDTNTTEVGCCWIDSGKYLEINKVEIDT